MSHDHPPLAKLIAKAPKRALVDALRNCNAGPSNLSMQDVHYLRQLARETARSDRGEQFLAHLAREVQYREQEKIGKGPLAVREEPGIKYRECVIFQSAVRSANTRARLYEVTGRFEKTAAALPFLPEVKDAMHWIDEQHATEKAQ